MDLLEERSFYYIFERFYGLWDLCVYDLVLFEYSLLCDELILVLEFGKRYNLDKYYGILIFEIMLVFFNIINSSD